MRSRRKLLLGVFFLIVALSGFVAFSGNVSAANTCSSADQIIFKISADTNAHGEVWNGSGGYTTEICYNQTFGVFGDGNRTCEIDSSNKVINKVIGLSADTNAHAEAPNEINYFTDVCYSDLSCNSRKIDCLPGEVSVVNLSSSTNAHLAVDSSYTTNICCTVGVVTGQCTITNAYWSLDEIDPIIDSDNPVFKDLTSYLVVEGTSECNDKTVSFEVFEDDGGATGDTVNVNPLDVVFLGNKAIGEWTTEYQSDGALGLGGNPEYKFIATSEGQSINSKTVGNLLLVVEDFSVHDFCRTNEILVCGHYTSRSKCGADFCTVAEVSNPTVDCSNPNIACSCFWDNVNSNCEPDWSGISTNPDESTSSIGNCISTESTSDTCVDDGFLSFEWTANWVWDSGNVYDSNPDPTGTDYILGTDLKYHYDPDDLHSSCLDGDRTVECPASIPLPFFGVYNFIFVLIMVSLIYVIMSTRRK